MSGPKWLRARVISLVVIGSISKVGRVFTSLSKLLFANTNVGLERYQQPHSFLQAREWDDQYFPSGPQCPKSYRGEKGENGAKS